jgi:hypothetical protein
MRIVVEKYADEYERYAFDIQLPEAGTRVPIKEGGEAVLVSAERVDDVTLRLVLDLPDEYRAAFAAPVDGFTVIPTLRWRES